MHENMASDINTWPADSTLGQLKQRIEAASPRPDLRDDPAFSAAVQAARERLHVFARLSGAIYEWPAEDARNIAEAVLGSYRAAGGKL